MTVSLRLQRQGKPKRPYYRLVAIDKRNRRDGAPIELLGRYDPMAASDKVSLNAERVQYWIKQGAQPSKTVTDILKRASLIEKKA